MCYRSKIVALQYVVGIIVIGTISKTALKCKVLCHMTRAAAQYRLMLVK